MDVPTITTCVLRLHKSGGVIEKEVETSHVQKRTDKTLDIAAKTFQSFAAPTPLARMTSEKEEFPPDENSVGYLSQGDGDEVGSVSSHFSFDNDVSFLPYNPENVVMKGGRFDTVDVTKVFKKDHLYGIFFHDSRERIVVSYQEKPFSKHTVCKDTASFGNNKSLWATFGAAKNCMTVGAVDPHIIQLSGRNVVIITVSKKYWPFCIRPLEHAFAEPIEFVFNSIS